MKRIGVSLSLLVCSAWLSGCKEAREQSHVPAPVFEELAATLRAACAECHGEEEPQGGYAVTSYFSTIGCVGSGSVAVEPSDERAPLLRVLSREDHRELLTAEQQASLGAWVRAGAPARRARVHTAEILNPRREGWHGKLAAADEFAALRSAADGAACGRCHLGAPVAPPWSAGNTEGATACTSCHGEPEGVLACATCHGQAGRAFPPRDACYFDASRVDPHAAHVQSTRLRSEPLACEACHPVPVGELFAGSHANGKLDVQLGSALAGAAARFEPDDASCAVDCHARGGERPEPAWRVEAPLDCQSCHASPPPDHYPGACSVCHGNMGEQPDSLQVDARHINGRVDLVGGAEGCGSCHGEDESGAPGDVGHQQHRGTLLTSAVACEVCHDAPETTNLRAPPTHMNGQREVRFSGRALGPEATPLFQADDASCSNVACHGAAQPRWGAPSLASSTCTACHATPPPPPHSQLPGCGGGLCHGSEVAPLTEGFRITESGRTLHIDGVLQAGGQ